mgnify:CR=1 FL=1
MVADRQVLFKGKRFNVEERDHRDIVVHPGSAVILALVDPEHLIMIKNKRVSVNKVLWELPAGTLEEHELPLITAKRELEEEAGYQAKNVKEIFSFYPSPGITDEKITAFIATDLKKTKQKLDPGEEIEVEVLSFTKVLDMIKSHEIEDAKTILTILWHALY